MPDTPFPTRFPIFPLPTGVLFPDAYLPLHMFEPRYRALTAAALASSRVIGMVLLRDVDTAPLQGHAPIYDIGCAGRIVADEKLPNGRYNITLQGARRFRVREQVEMPGGYLDAEVELLPDPTTDELDADTRHALERERVTLEARMVDFARLTAPRSADELRKRIHEMDSIVLLHAIAAGNHRASLEKQSLLEAEDPLARAILLNRLVEFELAALRLPDPGDQLN